MFNPRFQFDPDELPQLWRGQELAAARVLYSGLVPSADTVTDVTNIHPGGKRTIGQRLADLALSADYGRTQVPATGPVFDRVTFAGRGAVVHFRGVPQGLKTTDGQAPAHFEMAADDGQFLPADATINGDTIILTCPDIPDPAAVRYCWHETAIPNLVNSAGWPAYAFHTESETSLESK
jgi:sialate O-acetylesterase